MDFIHFAGEIMGILSPEIQGQILTFHYSDKRSIKSIAREFGVDPKTVRRVVRRREVHLGVRIGKRQSILDPFKPELVEFLKKDPRITNTSLLNHLRSRGYTGGVSIIKDFMKEARGRFVRPREAFLRLEFAPGEVAQVDWGEFGDVFGDGIKMHCFAVVLASSRMIYVEFTRSERFEEFIRCHENAFRFFGGVPRECWYDNLTTAVSDRMGGLVRFNARFMAYMGHHGTRPHACNVARGNEKGRVEDLIKYIRMNFWGGIGSFKSNDGQGHPISGSQGSLCRSPIAVPRGPAKWPKRSLWKPAPAAIAKNEWKALYCYFNKANKAPAEPPTIDQAIVWLAKLGGFLVRKSNGNPGPTNLWRGWSRLQDMAQMRNILVQSE